MKWLRAIDVLDTKDCFETPLTHPDRTGWIVSYPHLEGAVRASAYVPVPSHMQSFMPSEPDPMAPRMEIE
eukprot:13415197-Alexandrium_andersonii.AAC.1